MPSSGLTLMATIARSWRCVSAAVSFASWLSAGSTRTTCGRRGPRSGDTRVLASEALQVGVASFLPQHTGLRGRVAVLRDVLQNRGEHIYPGPLVGRVGADGRGGVLIEGLSVGYGRGTGCWLIRGSWTGCWRVSSR